MANGLTLHFNSAAIITIMKLNVLHTDAIQLSAEQIFAYHAPHRWLQTVLMQ